MPCPACGCTAIDGDDVHALVAALGEDDLDLALTLGLLEDDWACAGCTDTCRASLQSARHQRQAAFAARERHRVRNARLARRQRERVERRKPMVNATTTSLPPAAAAALARARARATGRKDP